MKNHYNTPYKTIITLILALTMLIPAAAARPTQHLRLQTPLAQDTTWPMFHHDLTHTGIANGTAPEKNNVLWSYEADGEVLSSPAIVNGKVYCASYNTSSVFCVREADGALLWKFTEADFIPYSSPAIINNKVYIGSKDKNIYCLNASTGAQIWNHTTGGMVYSSPTIVNNRLYIGSSDNKLYCLDATTGGDLWNFTTGGFVWCSPAVTNGKVYIGSMDAKMYCLNATTGAHLWNFTTGMIIYSSPTIVNGKVYFGSWGHSVYCLNADTGVQLWKKDIGSGTLGAIFATPAVAGGKVYIGVDWTPQGGFFCLNASNGDIIWNRTLNGAVYSSPAVADGKVYVGTCQDNSFYCFDADNGTKLWNFTGGDYFASSPAIADGKVFVGSNDHHLYCFGSLLEISSIEGGFFTVFARVRNNSPQNLTLNYSINFQGGLIILGRKNTGTVNIYPYDYTVVRSNLIFGFGKPVTLSVTVGNVTKSVQTQVFLIFVKILPS